MNTRKIVQGAVLGAAGGMAMAMWSMIALAATGNGFFTPVNLIAHTVTDSAPLDGGFDGGAFALGIAVHMMMSMGLGVTIAVLNARRNVSATVAAATAAVVPMTAWAVQLGVWDAIDPDAHARFTPWVLFVGHMMFGAVVAMATVIAHRAADRIDTPTATTPTRPRATVRA